MTLGFGILAAGLLLLFSGWRGRTLAETLAGELGSRERPETGAARIFDVPAFRETAADQAAPPAAMSTVANFTPNGSGARAVVDQVATLTAPFGTTVVSAYRPGSTTTSGNTSDHSSNDASRAARDIGVPGVDALRGPPPAQLDQAIVAVGQFFGRTYRGGETVVDTFNWQGFRVQVIWRTPAYGGHLGHIHVGMRAL